MFDLKNKFLFHGGAPDPVRAGEGERILRYHAGQSVSQAVQYSAVLYVLRLNTEENKI